MSNQTLKEQLQALSMGLSSAPNETKVVEKQKFKRPIRTETKPMKPKPAWLEQAQYGVELLKAYFPLCFKELKEIKPLKVGIKQDLAKFLSTRDDIVISDKACMLNSLAYYVNSPSYHKSVVEGANRIDLEGNAAGVITAEEANYSAECRKSKMQKKNDSSEVKKPIAEEATTG